MGDVVLMKGLTSLDLPVERVLDGAKHLESVLVLGWSKEGEFWAASSNGSAKTSEIVSLAQRFVHKFYNGDYE